MTSFGETGRFGKEFGSKFTDFLRAATEPAEEKLRRNADQAFTVVNERWGLASEEVRGLLGTSFTVDEMALYFPGRELLIAFIAKAVQRGWRVFNYAEDDVETRPIVGQYSVEYWFLQHDLRPYRLELMNVTDGFSPYHSSLQFACDQLTLPYVLAHASFKVAGDEAFGATNVALRAAGYELAQHCTSSYGKFSYYLGGVNNMPAIKPRINTRDGGVE